MPACSRSARRALSALNVASRLQGRAQAEATAHAIVAYLHERFDLPIAEPTPAEAADWLARYGGPAEQVRHLLADCAVERFGPGTFGDVIATARAFVLRAEEPTCPSS